MGQKNRDIGYYSQVFFYLKSEAFQQSYARFLFLKKFHYLKNAFIFLKKNNHNKAGLQEYYLKHILPKNVQLGDFNGIYFWKMSF